MHCNYINLYDMAQSLGGIEATAQIPGLVDSLLSGNIDGAEGTVFATISTADALIKAYQVYEDVQESSKVAFYLHFVFHIDYVNLW